jgi:imidazolonepropionase-like amidohydrolase
MSILLKNACILDANHDFIIRDILTGNKTIISVKEPGGTYPEADSIIDFSGYTVLPGFIDAHIHIAVDKGGFSDTALRAWVQNGVTTVRDLGMLNNLSMGDYAAWLKSKSGPEYAGVLSAGKYIDVEGGYGCGPDPAMKVGIIIDSPERAADAVSLQYAHGSSGIKLGIADTPGPPGIPVPPKPRPHLSPEMVKAIVDRAHSLGMWVSVHLKRWETLDWLADCGIDDAAHTPFDEMPDRLIKKAIDKGIMFITTIGNPAAALPPFIPAEKVPAIMEIQKKEREGTTANLKRIHAAGGLIAIGTDLIHSDDYSKDAAIAVPEMVQLREIGLSFKEVIRCATLNAAKICHIEDREGTIEAGKEANIIAVKERPDDTFESLKNVYFVMNRGTIVVNNK